VIGLGNYGEKYKNTRHNVGFKVVDFLAQKIGVRFRKPLFKNYEIAEYIPQQKRATHHIWQIKRSFPFVSMKQKEKTNYLQQKSPDNSIFLVKPLTYMNRSGAILNSVLKITQGSIEDIVVICDNLDLPPGSSRLKTKGSSGGQKGLASIIATINTEEFKRI